MCSRIMRDPVARRSAAEYLGNFIADASEGGFTIGTQWLVWKFESDTTLQIASSVSPPPPQTPTPATPPHPTSLPHTASYPPISWG